MWRNTAALPCQRTGGGHASRERHIYGHLLPGQDEGRPRLSTSRSSRRIATPRQRVHGASVSKTVIKAVAAGIGKALDHTGSGAFSYVFYGEGGIRTRGRV